MVMQPAPGDVATLLHPKYKVTSCGKAADSNGTCSSASSQLEHAVAAARAFNQVEAAAAGFSGRQIDSTTGMLLWPLLPDCQIQEISLRRSTFIQLTMSCMRVPQLTMDPSPRYLCFVQARHERTYVNA